MNAIPPSAVVTAFSDARDERLAAGELAAKLRHDHLGCVLFFCSIDYRLDRLAGALAEAFGDLEPEHFHALDVATLQRLLQVGFNAGQQFAECRAV